MAKILIIDDDEMMNAALASAVKKLGHQVFSVWRLQEGIKIAAREEFDVVFLDVRMPDGDGLDALPVIRSMKYRPEVIILTGYGNPDGAEIAIREGAWDYVKKPSSLQDLMLPLIRALQYREARTRKNPATVADRREITGSSPSILQALELAAQAADCDASVLILGETGTGKELFAKVIHNNSSRCEQRFVIVDCAAIPQSLAESILFGHSKGAFTGADKDREGLLDHAHGGTLFLDELGELPLSVQGCLLRVLQEHRYYPVGSAHMRESRFRLISATNRNLKQLVTQGRFREDLYFRIRSLEIQIPPLRRRIEDIEPLLKHYLDRMCKLFNVSPKSYVPEFLEAIQAYEWPGNVREFVHAVQQTVANARYESALFPRHLPTDIRIKLTKRPYSQEALLDEQAPVDPSEGPKDPGQVGLSDFPKYRDYREKSDRTYLADMLRLSRGVRKNASEISGISRTRLFELLKRYGMDEP